jgi:hypothetical protein
MPMCRLLNIVDNLLLPRSFDHPFNRLADLEYGKFILGLDGEHSGALAEYFTNVALSESE